MLTATNFLRRLPSASWPKSMVISQLIFVRLRMLPFINPSLEIVRFDVFLEAFPRWNRP